MLLVAVVLFVIITADAPYRFVQLNSVDIQMPVMDGYEAAAVIRALPRKDAADIPILALTANAFVSDIGKAQSSGMNDHISKPIDIDRLAAVLSAWIK